jgi:hypothetical protein
MKMKFTKKTMVIIGAVFILLLMIVQMFAYTILQAVGPQTKEKKLLKQEIITYELPFDEESGLISQGITILKFYYTVNCLDCLNQKNSLEFLANQYKGEFLLEELQSNQTITTPILIISSARDTVTLNNATNFEIVDNLCDLMLQPPIEFRCAVRNV